MTGGVGREKLSHFYANHFIFKNPADAELEVISRTVGIDRVVDEFIYKITHDCEVDWLYVPSSIWLFFVLIARLQYSWHPPNRHKTPSPNDSNSQYPWRQVIS